MNSFSLCPCHSQVLYDACCGRFHKGESPAVALELMRARYCAYALALADYIIQTTHHKNPSFKKNKAAWKQEIFEFCQSSQFEGLTILEFVDGEKQASVTFSARLKQNDKDCSFTEKSSFVRESGRWFYRSGEILN